MFNNVLQTTKTKYAAARTLGKLFDPLFARGKEAITADVIREELDLMGGDGIAYYEDLVEEFGTEEAMIKSLTAAKDAALKKYKIEDYKLQHKMKVESAAKNRNGFMGFAEE
jgi:hypothetical protein